MGKYFGTDGIRGKAHVTLMPQLAYKVGQGLSLLENKKLVIGWDTRESSTEFMESIKAGAMSVGLQVLLLGVIPTPGLIKASKELKMLGVMITASHNPYYDNGIKVIKCGEKINADDKKLIEDYIDGLTKVNITNDGTFENYDFKSTYINFLLEHAKKTDFKVVFDAANGASSDYARIYKDYVKELKIIANEPNGTNINNGVGATHLELLRKNMIGYDIGIALDGDGDRIIIVDENDVFDGDKIIYLFAKYFAKHQMLTNNTVVLTKMSNLGMINKLADEGINVVLTDVGDQNVIDEMKRGNYALGGENSGHIITPYLSTGDGLLNGLILLSILGEEKQTLQELTNIPMYFDKLINLQVKDKKIVQNEKILNFVKKIESSFGKYGKVILRASGTENLVRVSVMHKDKEIMEKNINELVKLINTLDEE